MANCLLVGCSRLLVGAAITALVSKPGHLRPQLGSYDRTRGIEDRTRGSETPDRDYVQLRHFIYFSPSSASAEREYGILEPKFPDGGHCQSVLRRPILKFNWSTRRQIKNAIVYYNVPGQMSSPRIHLICAFEQ